MDKIFFVLLKASFVYIVSRIITQEDIFEHPRYWITLLSDFLGKLFSCIFCFSVWMSIATNLVFPCTYNIILEIAICILLSALFDKLLQNGD